MAYRWRKEVAGSGCMKPTQSNGLTTQHSQPAETHNQKRSRFYSDLRMVASAAVLALMTFVRGLA